MRKFILALVALLSIGGAYSFANYTMTQGAGTTFGSVLVGGFHYVQMFVCDLTTPAQCASVSAGGAVKVDASAITQPVSGTVTTTPPSNASTNVAQINAVTPLMGNGVTGTGSQRVTVASDNTAFSVNSTLTAETTKVIGTVRNLGNAGAITDFAGQNAASPANSWLIGGQFNTTPTTITSGNSSPFQLDNSGKLLVNCSAGCTGGSASNASSGVATSSTNGTTDAWLYGFNGTTWDQLLVDASKFLKVNCSAGCTGAADGTQAFSITSSTTSTALALVGTNSVQFNLTGTWAGTVVGQISNDNTNWVSVPLLNMSVAPPAYSAAATGATANGNYLLVGTQGARYARVSVTFTSGTVAGTMTAVSQGPSVTFGDYVNYLQIISSTPAGANIIGKVGIDQTTPGTTNAVNTTNWPTTVDTNSGNKSASTPRFVIATDQPNLTTALNVALAANQSVNVAQFGGVSTATGQVAVSTAPVTATNTALVVDLRPDSPGIIALGPAADTSAVPNVLTPTGNSNSGITPVVGGSAVSSLVLKASAGSLYAAYADCTSACWLMIFNATSAPSNGATTSGVASGNLVECVPIGAGSIGGVNYGPGPPAVYSVGMTAAISSTSCSTLTLSPFGFIHGMVKYNEKPFSFNFF